MQLWAGSSWSAWTSATAAWQQLHRRCAWLQQLLQVTPCSCVLSAAAQQVGEHHVMCSSSCCAAGGAAALLNCIIHMYTMHHRSICQWQLATFRLS